MTSALPWAGTTVAAAMQGSLPPEDLHAVASLVTEDKEVPRKRALFKDVLHHHCKTIKAAAHISGLEAEDDSYRCRQAQHAALSSTATTDASVS